MTDRSGRLLVAFMLIAIGLFFSVATFYPELVRADRWWPLFILVPGVAMFGTGLVAGVGGKRETAGLVIPGTIVTTVGLLFLYAANTGRWGFWAYNWTLIVASVGLGLIIAAQFGAAAKDAATVGLWLLVIGVGLFAVIGAFVEGIMPRREVLRWWPLLLVLLGVIVLLGGRRKAE